MKRKIYLYWGNDERYEVASDATITEEYSETLDSASAVLPSVKSSSGIVYEARPYDEVYLSVVLADGTEEYGAWMLIDSIDAAQVSYTGDDKYFDVTLQLMSETKYLEKIQMPNVSLTHSLIDGAKTLYEAIEYYLGIYGPSGSFYHKTGRNAVISIDDGADWSKFKATPCADVMMSKPTLRQCLTTLMSQIGCIPVVKHRKLTYLDLGAPHGEFAFEGKAPNEVGSERRSMSSDSWVNTLVSECSQAIDKNSTSVVESLCFRDRENVLLKQTENLKLETRFPIYSVKRLAMNAYVRGKMHFNALYVNGSGGGVTSSLGPCGVRATSAASGPGAFGLNVSVVNDSSGAPKLKIEVFNGVLYKVYARAEIEFHQVLATVNGDGSLSVKKTIDNEGYIEISGKQHGDSYSYVYVDTFDASDYTGNEVTLVSFRLSDDARNYIGYGTGDDQKWVPSADNPNIGFATDSYDGAPSHNQHQNYFEAYNWKGKAAYDEDFAPSTYFRKSGSEECMFSSADITPLCVESTKRAQLEVDFLNMPEWGSLETMSKYFYATVGYSIGGTSIEGFSATYSESKGFWTSTKTYIENIMDAIGPEKEGVNRYYAGFFDQEWWNYMFDDMKIENPFFNTNGDGIKHNNFSVLFFDVEYIPLIQSKIAYGKDDFNIQLEQLDSAESGVSSLDAVSRLEEQKADRLGNPVHSFHARCESYSDLPALNSAWGDRIAFKRVLKFGANAIDAEYVLSKDYVIKNYFTSVITKYRAYEYVDYSQSIERRESMRAYIRLTQAVGGASMNAYNSFSVYTKNFPSGLSTARTFIDSLEGYQGSGTRLTCGGFYDASATSDEDKYITECELSTAVTGSKCVLTLKEYDNESDGSYVDGTYLTISGAYKDNPIGGIPQKWYPSNGGKVRSVCFHSVAKPLREEGWGQDADSYVQTHVRAMQKYPRYYYQSLSSATDFDSFWMIKLPFEEKDASELLSLSLQFEACWSTSASFNDKSAVRFGKWLFRFSSALGGYPSESARLAFRSIGETDAWTDAQRVKSASEEWTETDYFLKYGMSYAYFINFSVSDGVYAAAQQSAVELAVLDGSAVYPVARIGKGALNNLKSVNMSCAPSKTDKVLKESAGHSLLYES